MEISWHIIELNLTDPFTISRETKTLKQNVIVQVTDGIFTGLGEAAPSAFYGQSILTVVKALDALREFISNSEEGPVKLLSNFRAMSYTDMAAVAAVDVALHDIAAKRAGLPVYAYLGLKGEIAHLTSFTIGIDSTEVMLRKVERAEEHPILKVKLGFPEDMEALKAIRGATGKTIRVDVNGGWSLEEAVAKFPLLISMGVEYVEQPLRRGELERLMALRDKFPLPIFVDEDAIVPEDVPKLVGAVDGINVKLMKCGGLMPALKMIDEARKGGLKVMLGCMIESSVGITAAAHIASLADYLDLDGNLLIENDPFVGVKCHGGRLLLPDAPGLGAEER